MMAYTTRQFTQQHYIAMLRAFLFVWERVNTDIDWQNANSLKPCVEARREALRGDLRSLVGIDDTSQNSFSTKFNEYEYALGYCYVLIGSSLGATQLLKDVQACLPDVSVNYLQFSPKQAGWFVCRDLLETNSIKKRNQICTAAQQAFTLINEKLTEFSGRLNNL